MRYVPYCNDRSVSENPSQKVKISYRLCQLSTSIQQLDFWKYSLKLLIKLSYGDSTSSSVQTSSCLGPVAVTDALHKVPVRFLTYRTFHTYIRTYVHTHIRTRQPHILGGTPATIAYAHFMEAQIRFSNVGYHTT